MIIYCHERYKAQLIQTWYQTQRVMTEVSLKYFFPVYYCSQHFTTQESRKRRTLLSSRLSVVGRGRDVTASSGPVDVNILVEGQLLALLAGDDSEGVGTEVVSLGLDQGSGQLLSSVTVEEGQGGGEGRDGDTPQGGLGDDSPPSGLGVLDGVLEEVIEQQGLELGVLLEGLGDIGQEDAK